MAVQFSGGNELVDAQKFLAAGGVKTGDTVADLGCGASGHFVFPAARVVGDTGRVFAVDILPSVLQSIESRGKIEGAGNVIRLWADIERPGATKIPGGADVAVLANTLFQTKDPQAAIRTAADILKPGGVLLVGEWKSSGATFGPAAMMRVDAAKVKQWAKDADLALEREFEPGPYHYGLLFRKRA